MQQDANTLVDILTGQRPGDTHKREMVAAICNNIRDHALKLVPAMLEEWDGHEIRSMLAELFSREVTNLMRDHRGKRWREYDRERIQQNMW